MYKKILAIFLCIFSVVYAGAVPAYAADSRSDLSGVAARYYEAYDITSGQELLGKHESEKMYPASITKLLFADVLTKKLKKSGLSLEDTAGKVTAEDNERAVRAGLYRSGLRAGEEVTWSDLLHSIVFMSGAEACYAASRMAFGSEKKAVRQMRVESRSLGMNHSNFLNSTGVHNPRHYTTCADFVKLMSAIWENPELQKIFGEGIYTTSDKQHRFVPPVKRAGKKYEKFLMGGKTGTTDAAHHTFAGYAEIDGHVVVIVVGYCPLTVPHSNISSAAAISEYIQENYDVKDIPAQVEVGDAVYDIKQTEGATYLIRKDAKEDSYDIKGDQVTFHYGSQKVTVPIELSQKVRKENYSTASDETEAKDDKKNPVIGFVDFIRKLAGALFTKA